MQKGIKRNFALLIIFIVLILALISIFCCGHPLDIANAATAYSSSDTVFNITTQQEFDVFVSIASELSFRDKRVNLFTDVDASKLTTTIFSNYTNNTSSDNYGFSGVFNGNGYSIRNLKQPIFNSIGKYGVVKNLVILNYTGTNNSFNYVLCDTNKGIINNVSIYGSTTNSIIKGVVYTNSKSITALNTFIEFTTSVPLVYNNASSISNSVNYNKYTSSTLANYYLFTNSVTSATASISDCMASVFINVDTDNVNTVNVFPFGTTLPGSSSVAQTIANTAVVLDTNASSVTYTAYDPYMTIQNTYYVFGSDYYVFDSSGPMVNPTSSDLVNTNLSSNFIFNTDIYPVPKNILTGSGDSLDKYKIKSLKDLSLLAININYASTTTPVYANIVVDLDLTLYPYFTQTGALNNISDLGAVYVNLTSNGYLYNAQNRATPFALFTYTYNGIFDVTTTVGIDSIPDGYNDMSSINDIVGDISNLEGSGTSIDPYLISSKEELVGFIKDSNKNTSSAYAYITKDIIVNSPASHNNTLGLSAYEMKATLLGMWHNLVNVDDGMFDTISGVLQNSVIYYAAHEQKNVVLSDKITGDVEYVFIKNAYNYEEDPISVFATTLDGTISYCENEVDNNYIIKDIPSGQAEYIMDLSMYNGPITNNPEKVLKSIYYNRGSNTGYIINGTRTAITSESNATYECLKAASWDVQNVLGYPVGESLNYPRIRVDGVKYRKEYSGIVNNISNYLNSTYGNTYTVSSIEDYLVPSQTDINVVFTWTKDGDSYVETDISNVGVYEVIIDISGNNIFNYQKISSATISKATYSGAITFDTEVFGNLAFTYSGSSLDVSNFEITIDSTNITNLNDLELAGFNTWTWIYSSNDIKNAGVYTQTLKCSSTNYNDITAVRNITIQKKNLDLTLPNVEVVYNEAVDYSGYSINMTGMAAGDTFANFNELAVGNGVNNYTAYYSTNYTVGSNVGEYTLTYSCNLFTNYTLSVSGGKVTCVNAEIDTTGITFSDQAFTYDKTSHSLQVVGADPSITIIYENNGKINANTYVVTATLSKANYNNKVLNANLTINKKTVTITADDKSINYNVAINYANFTYSITENLDSDELVIIQGASLAVDIDTVANGSKPDAGSYTISYSNAGADLDNYQFSFVNGTLTVNKILLVHLYPAASYSTGSAEYTGSAITNPITFFENNSYPVSIEYVYYSSNVTVPEMVNVGTYYIEATCTPTGDLATNYSTTIYQCEFTITRIVTSIEFDEDSYVVTFEYKNSAVTDYAVDSNYTYTSSRIPVNGEITYTYYLGSAIVTEIKNAGTYTVKVSYAGDGVNYYGCEDTATIVVNKLKTYLTMTNSYVYTGSSITPNVSLEYGENKDEDGQLTSSDFTYQYTYSQTIRNVIIDANTYGVTVTCTNTNYELQQTEYTATITKRNIELDFGQISFVYGTTGEVAINTATINIYGDGRILYESYYVEETNRYVNIIFKLATTITNGGKYYADTYVLEDSFILSALDVETQGDNYNCSFSDGTNEVIITERQLLIVWTYDELELPDVTYQVLYEGTSLMSLVSYKVSNVATSDTTPELNVRYQYARQDGATKITVSDIYNAGVYYLTLTVDTVNYTIDPDSDVFTLTVIPITVVLTIQDTEVKQYEDVIPSFTIDNPQGDDIGKSVKLYSGYTFRLECDYNKDTSQAGDIYTIDGTFTFTNYIVGTINTGTLTVTEGYPIYAMSDRTYEYDGTSKTMTIDGGVNNDGTTVSYVNNTKTNVGEYTVVATVTYPSGRTSTLSAKLTIVKATPIVDVIDVYTVYQANTVLDSSYLKASAKLNTLINSVPGTFEFNGEYQLLEGVNNYAFTFTPFDQATYNSVTASQKITAYTVAETILVASGDYEVDQDENYILKGEMNITLNKTPYVGIEDRLTMQADGQIVTKAVIKVAKSTVVKVLFDNKEIISYTYNTLLEDSDNDFKIDYNMISATDAVFKNTEETLYVTSTGATIQLDSQYKSEYRLLVNDEEIVGTYVISTSIDKINIKIVKKSIGVSVYNKSFTVVVDDDVVKEEQNKGEQTVDNKTSLKGWHWGLIGGGAGLLVIILVVVLVLWRKNN